MNTASTWRVVCLLIGLVIAASQQTEARTGKTVSKLTQKQIENGVLLVPSDCPEQVKLTNGCYKRGDYTVALETIAFGDLNGDGATDATAVFYWNGGGTGYFENITAFLNKGGKPVQTSSKVVGDRVGIRGLKIKSGVIILDATSHGPNDPAGMPTMERRVKYRLKGKELIGPDSVYE